MHKKVVQLFLSSSAMRFLNFCFVRVFYISTFVLVIPILFLSEAAAEENSSAKQCVRGLLTAQRLIDDRNLPISKKYFKGVMGWLMLQNKFKYEALDAIKAETGALKDIHACIDLNLWSVSDHTIILNALNGFYENGGEDILTDCAAAIQIIEAKANRLFGSDVGKKIGYQLGQLLGGAVAKMGYLFTEHPYDSREILTKGASNVARLNNMNDEKRRTDISIFVNSCSKIGIDAKLAIDALSIFEQAIKGDSRKGGK